MTDDKNIRTSQDTIEADKFTYREKIFYQQILLKCKWKLRMNLSIYSVHTSTELWEI